MANTRYVTPNSLRVQVHQYRRTLLIAGLPATVGGFALHPVLGILSSTLLMVLWDRSGRRLAGAKGEERALGLPVAVPGSLTELPDHYILFNNLVVPDGNGGTRELDLVVLARNGLFVVEVKHLRGLISGAENDRCWQQTKRNGHSRTSTPLQIRNPALQARSASGVLHRFLASKGIDIWVQGVVVFTHPHAALQVTPGSIPVVLLPELARTIADFPVTRPPRQFIEIVEVLKRLRPGVAQEYTDSPRHVGVFMRDFVTAQERLAGLSWTGKRRLRKAAHALPVPLAVPIRPALLQRTTAKRARRPRKPERRQESPREITLIQRVTTIIRHRVWKH